MNCVICNREAEVDSVGVLSGYDHNYMSVNVLTNGKRCIECETFSCTPCLNAADVAAFPNPFTFDLCLSCNHAHDIAA